MRLKPKKGEFKPCCDRSYLHQGVNKFLKKLVDRSSLSEWDWCFNYILSDREEGAEQCARIISGKRGKRAVDDPHWSKFKYFIDEFSEYPWFYDNVKYFFDNGCLEEPCEGTDE